MTDMTPHLSADQDHWARLTDYFSGRCSADEQREFEAWIEADPARAADVASIRAVWQSLRDRTYARPSADRQATDTKRMLRKMRESDLTRAARMPGARFRASRLGRILHPTGAVMNILRLSAAAAAGGTIAIGINQYQDFRVRSIPAARAYATTAAQWSTIRLPDGSGVTIGPESELRYRTTGASGTRALELVGEGLFTVAHDDKRPFVVRAGGLVTTDVGTTFGITAYRGDTASVAVKTGIVTVEALQTGRTDTLVAGQQGVLAGDQFTRRASDTLQAFGWAAGVFSPRQEPFPAVVRDVQRIYGITLVPHDPTLNTRLVTVTIYPAIDRDAAIDMVVKASNALREKGPILHDTLTIYDAVGQTGR
jgi:ferric-dicitrate binding protein FerR (iron transport regulator)